MPRRKSRLAGIKIDETEKKGSICSYCGNKIAENPSDPVIIANIFDEAMVKMKYTFRSKVSTFGVYHTKCGMDLAKMIKDD